MISERNLLYKKLGEEYEFSYLDDDSDEDGYYGGEITHNKGKTHTICIREDGEVDRDSLIVYALLYPYNGVELYGLNENSEEQDVLNVLGEPNKKSKDIITERYEYISEDMLLVCRFDVESGKLRAIVIDVSKSWN